MADIEIHSDAFQRLLLPNVSLEHLAGGFRWTEGPVWFGDGGYLLFSDIPNNRILRWREADGGIDCYRSPSSYANGHTRDQQGRLISCEHGTRSVSRTEHDGSLTSLVSQYQGKRLNSPNDVIVKRDGSIWFSDPHYGIATAYEGFAAESELDCHVYRLDPDTGAISAAVTALDCPNGLCFSPDESTLYVADTGYLYDPAARQLISAFDVAADGTVSNQRDFYQPEVGVADGFRCDVHGNLWSSAGDGVHCISPAGELLGKILVPETVSNICFGGRADARNRLFICATSSLYSIYLNTSGVQWP